VSVSHHCLISCLHFISLVSVLQSCYSHVVLTIPDSALHNLHRSRATRLQHAFRPGTKINQHVQIKRYYTFCRRFNLLDINPSPSQLTLYIEYLSLNLRSAQSVRNYVSAVSLIHRQLGLDFSGMQTYPVTNMLRAVDRTLRSPILPKLPVTIPLLYKLISACQKLGTWGLVFKCAILFCFFVFLRQSNVAPRSLHLWDSTRDTLRSDVQATTHGLLLRLKWSKTHQGAHSPLYIPLPDIRGSPLCPTRAFQHMCRCFPTTTPTTPLLIYGSPGTSTAVVTSRMLADQLRILIIQLRLPPSRYTLHSLRQGGATFCHSLGIPVEQIKAHGTWKSDTVWTYINPTHSDRSIIPATMSQAIQTRLVHN
jgi:hypothetical protein